MSSLDEKDNAVPADSNAQTSLPNDTSKDKMDEKENETSGFIIFFFIIGLVASLIAGWVIFPKLLYSKKDQPINFNHLLHMAEVDDGCQSCHFLRTDGSFSGIPGLKQCIGCHDEIQGESKDEAIFVEEYVQKGREVPWLIYSRQQDCVFFSHAAHIKGADMDCVTCHGHIGESEQTRVYEENRITGVSRDIWGKSISGFNANSWERMKMNDCAKCHKEAIGKASSVQTGKEGCFVCHK